MARLVILLALVALSGVIAQSPKFNQFREIGNDTSVLARINSGTDATSADLLLYPFLITVWDPATIGNQPSNTNTGEGYGPCVLINCKYYVLCHSDLHNAVTDANVPTLRATANSLSGIGSGSSVITRKVKQRFRYVASSPTILQQLQIFKVCPSFADTSVYKLTVAAPPTTAGTPYKFFNYDMMGGLLIGTKNIGESCECDGYTTPTYPAYSTVDPATWCGQGHATVYVLERSKKGSIGVVTDGTVQKFAGINVATAQGELFLDPYEPTIKAWIDTTAPVCT